MREEEEKEEGEERRERKAGQEKAEDEGEKEKSEGEGGVTRGGEAGTCSGRAFPEHAG